MLCGEREEFVRSLINKRLLSYYYVKQLNFNPIIIEGDNTNESKQRTTTQSVNSGKARTIQQ